MKLKSSTKAKNELSKEAIKFLKHYDEEKALGALIRFISPSVSNPNWNLVNLEASRLICTKVKKDFSISDIIESDRMGNSAGRNIAHFTQRLLELFSSLKRLSTLEKPLLMRMIEKDLKLEFEKQEKIFESKIKFNSTKISKKFAAVLDDPNYKLILSTMAILSSSDVLRHDFHPRHHHKRDEEGNTIREIMRSLSEFYPKSESKTLFHPDSVLFHKNICSVSFKDVVNSKWQRVRISLNTDIFSSSDEDPDFEIGNKEKIITPKMTFDDVILDVENKSDIKDFIKAYKSKKIKSASFLFHGASGVGKSSLAQGIAHELGMNVVQFSTEGLTESELPAAITFLMNKYRRSKSVLVFDECESLWYRPFSFFSRGREENAEKGEIKRVLENMLGVVIFISNVDPSETFKRRVSYCLKIKDPSARLRQVIFKTRLDSISSEMNVKVDVAQPEIEDLADRFELSGGFFNQAMLLSYVKSPGSLSKSSLEYGLNKVSAQLEGHSSNLTARLGFADLSLSDQQIKEFTRIKSYIQSKKLNPNQDPLMPQGATIFFEGPAGVGKTMVAEAFAKELGLKFKLVTPSSFLDMYVGQTEKKIAKVFSNSEDDTLLFLDEAEGMLSSRSQAVRSWEKTQIDEFLKQIENFKGVFIAATNHKEMIDHAFSRRFLFHIKFDYPGDETRSSYILKHLGASLDEFQARAVAFKYKLSFGEMRNAIIRVKARESVTSDEIESEFQKQISFRFIQERKRIGINA